MQNAGIANYDEVDHTKAEIGGGGMFSGEFQSSTLNAQHRLNVSLLWPFLSLILRCLIFMCFKVCYKLNKNHTREEEVRVEDERKENRRNKSKWNYISRIEYVVNRKKSDDGEKMGIEGSEMCAHSKEERNDFAIFLKFKFQWIESMIKGRQCPTSCGARRRESHGPLNSILLMTLQHFDYV